MISMYIVIVLLMTVAIFVMILLLRIIMIPAVPGILTFAIEVDITTTECEGSFLATSINYPLCWWA